MSNTIKVDRGDLFSLIQAAHAALEHAEAVLPTWRADQIADATEAEAKLRDELLG
jgi:hypothetical protein